MTIWRDVQAEARALQKRKQWKAVRVVGLDGAYVLGWGSKQPVLVAVDLGSGEPLAVGYVNEHDPQAVRRWLAPLVQQHGITVIVTDDLSSYKIVTEKLQLGHQICQFLSAAGWAKPCGSCRKLFPKNGSGSWTKSMLSWTSCLPMAARACMPSGRSSPDVAPSLTNRVLPWNNFVTCSYV
jgi:hypothetical protein